MTTTREAQRRPMNERNDSMSGILGVPEITEDGALKVGELPDQYPHYGEGRIFDTGADWCSWRDAHPAQLGGRPYPECLDHEAGECRTRALIHPDVRVGLVGTERAALYTYAARPFVFGQRRATNPQEHRAMEQFTRTRLVIEVEYSERETGDNERPAMRVSIPVEQARELAHRILQTVDEVNGGPPAPKNLGAILARLAACWADEPQV